MCLLDAVQQCNRCPALWVEEFVCLRSAVGSGQQQKNTIKLGIIIRVIMHEGLCGAA